MLRDPENLSRNDFSYAEWAYRFPLYAGAGRLVRVSQANALALLSKSWANNS